MGAGMSTRGNMSSIGSSVRTCAQGGGRHAAPLEVCVLHAVGQLVRLTASWPGQARAVCFCVRLRTYRCMTWKRLAAGGLWGGGGLAKGGLPNAAGGQDLRPLCPTVCFDAAAACAFPKSVVKDAKVRPGNLHVHLRQHHRAFSMQQADGQTSNVACRRTTANNNAAAAGCCLGACYARP